MVRRSLQLALACAVLVVGCGPSGTGSARVPSSVSAPAEAPSLPDLSSASAAVREQLQTAFARVEAAKASGTPSSAYASACGDLGVLLLAAGYYDTAETALLHARAGSPENADWAAYLGHTYRLRNEPALAVKAFADARALRPKDIVTLVHLGEMQLASGETDAAERTLGEALALDAGSARTLGALGRAALSRNDYATAISRLEQALALAPQASALRYPLSLAYRGAGDATRSAAELAQRGTVDAPLSDPLMERASALDSASMYDNRSRVALQRGEWQTATAEARRGLALSGSPPTIVAALQHRLGTALAQTGDLAAAKAAFEASVAADPKMARAHYSLSLLHLGAGRVGDAVASLNRAIDADPGYQAALVLRGDVARQRGQARAALDDYERALAVDPKSPQARFGAAMALTNLGRHEDALARLQAGLNDAPGDVSLTVALARLLAASPSAAVRNPGRALSLVEPIVSRTPTLEAVETMARSLAALGRFPEAADLERQAAARAQEINQPALAAAMQETARLYQQRQQPRWVWREEPLYETAQ